MDTPAPVTLRTNSDTTLPISVVDRPLPSGLVNRCTADLTRRKRKYLSQPLESAGLAAEGKLADQQQQAYLAGQPLEPRISIE